MFFFVLYHHPFLELLRATKSAWDFSLGLIFGPGIFLGFAGSPRDIFGSWLLASFDHPRHLQSRVPPGPEQLSCPPLAVSREKNFLESHVINPLLTKLVRSRWLKIGLVLFCEFMGLYSVSVHKHAKKNLTNIQPS